MKIHLVRFIYGILTLCLLVGLLLGIEYVAKNNGIVPPHQFRGIIFLIPVVYVVGWAIKVCLEDTKGGKPEKSSRRKLPPR